MTFRNGPDAPGTPAILIPVKKLLTRALAVDSFQPRAAIPFDPWRRTVAATVSRSGLPIRQQGDERSGGLAEMV